MLKRRSVCTTCNHISMISSFSARTDYHVIVPFLRIHANFVFLYCPLVWKLFLMCHLTGLKGNVTGQTKCVSQRTFHIYAPPYLRTKYSHINESSRMSTRLKERISILNVKSYIKKLFFNSCVWCELLEK